MKPLTKSLVLTAVLLVAFTAVAAVPSLQTRMIQKRSADHVYMIKGEDGQGGTAFQIRAPSGKTYLVTNSHICEGESDGKTILVLRDDDVSIGRKVLKIDNRSDLCLIEGWIGDKGLLMGADVEDDQKVTEIGHPHLAPLTISEGKVIGHTDVEIRHHIMSIGVRSTDQLLNASKEACKGPKYSIKKQDLPVWGMLPIKNVTMCFVTETDAIKIDNETHPGNSGSPLLDRQGRVVGVIFAVDGAGIGYAVNLTHLKLLLKDR